MDYTHSRRISNPCPEALPSKRQSCVRYKSPPLCLLAFLSIGENKLCVHGARRIHGCFAGKSDGHFLAIHRQHDERLDRPPRRRNCEKATWIQSALPGHPHTPTKHKPRTPRNTVQDVVGIKDSGNARPALLCLAYPTMKYFCVVISFRYKTRCGCASLSTKARASACVR